MVSKLPLFTELRSELEDLAGCDKLLVLETTLEGEKGNVSDTVGSNATVHLHVPDELRRAFQVDVEMLEKKRGKLEGELEKLKRNTFSEKYARNAPEEIKEADRKKVRVFRALYFS